MANNNEKNKAKSLVTLAEGEVIIKNYHCLQMADRGKNGYVCVSNKRVFMLETSTFNNSVRKSEVPIENVSGINSSYYRAPLWGRLVLALILFTLFALAAWGAIATGVFGLRIILWIVAIIIGLIGILVIIKARRRELCMTIYTKSAISAFMTVNNLNKKGEDKSFSSWRFRGTKQCFDMISEIGALILDVQAHGKDIAPKYFSKSDAMKDKKDKVNQQQKLNQAKENVKKAELNANKVFNK